MRRAPPSTSSNPTRKPASAAISQLRPRTHRPRRKGSCRDCCALDARPEGDSFAARSDGRAPETGSRLWTPSRRGCTGGAGTVSPSGEAGQLFDRFRESLTFSRKNFERKAVVHERALIRDELRRGMGEITHGQVRANLEARLASGEFQIVDRSRSIPGRQFTIAKTIEAEHEGTQRIASARVHGFARKRKRSGSSI
jgi:hypothetical protein